MSRQAVTAIIPGKLYQRGQFLGWPYALKRRMLDTLGIDVVVNLWHKVDPDLSSPAEGHIYLMWHTSPSDVPPDADTMVETVARLLKGGHKVLIHCEAGRGRSVWFSARVLAAYTGMPKPDAWAQVERLIPGNAVTVPLLKDLGVKEGIAS